MLGFDVHSFPECTRMCPNVPECACVMCLNVPLLLGGPRLLLASSYVLRDVRSAHWSPIAGIDTGSPALSNLSRKTEVFIFPCWIRAYGAQPAPALCTWVTDEEQSQLTGGEYAIERIRVSGVRFFRLVPQVMKRHEHGHGKGRSSSSVVRHCFPLQNWPQAVAEQKVVAGHLWSMFGSGGNIGARSCHTSTALAARARG